MSPRIALVVSSTSSESGPLLAARLRHLLDLGWDARLLCKGERWADEPALRDGAVRDRVEHAAVKERYGVPRSLLRRPADRARYLAAPGEPGPFDSRLLKLRPDLVHFHSGWAGWKGLRLKRLLGCRAVVSFREDGQDLAVPDPRLLWDEADRLVFAEAATLERAVARGWPTDKAEVLPAPVQSPASAVERERAPGALSIVSAGSVIWEQGFEHSVHAVRLLLDMGVDCEYRLIGNGDHIPAVAFARYKLGLAGHVELVAPNGSGSLDELLSAADVFVDPAVTGTTSQTALVTAQTRGVPFVATRRAGLPEDAGIAVPRRNARAIADGLARLAADPGLRRRMGQAARLVHGYTTLEAHLAALERLYRSVLGATG